MPLKAVPMMSRLGLRLRARRQVEGEASSLTDEDRGNLESFERVLGRTLDLLEAENAALAAGDTAAVAGLYDEKAHLLKTLELHQPRIEPFLREGGEHMVSLRDLIRRLAEQLQINGRLLKGMAEASQAILDEVERARSRHSLHGLYDKTGQLLSNVGLEARDVKKSL